jgi:hypothetical protein
LFKRKLRESSNGRLWRTPRGVLYVHRYGNSVWEAADGCEILVGAGEQLGTGWRPALRVLEAVPQDPETDAEAVGLAFQSVQLLASDYMAGLPLDLLRSSLEVAALFGSQQVASTPPRVSPGAPLSLLRMCTQKHAHTHTHRQSHLALYKFPCHVHMHMHAGSHTQLSRKILILPFSQPSGGCCSLRVPTGQPLPGVSPGSSLTPRHVHARARTHTHTHTEREREIERERERERGRERVQACHYVCGRTCTCPCP